MALQESDRLVIFGITGDLAKKMTLPSLYRLEVRGLLRVPIISVAFEDWTLEKLIAHAHDCISHVEGSIDEEVFARFAARLSYIHGDFKDPLLYAKLTQALVGAKAPTFYLEIPPQLFVVVAQQIAAVGLLAGDARIVFEKPFGTSLETAVALNKVLHSFMREEQIFRLDHYLGKEPVLDLLYLRFSNTWFEPTWNNHYVDCVMITMAENFGVQDRGSFYDSVGTIRDVVQNHLFQVLGLTTMEIPVADFSSPRYNIFKAMPDADATHMVRGQYDGYLDTPGVRPGSTTETFVALKLYINSWRWAGVPIFIRAGKNLPVKATEVVIRMKRLNPIFINGGLREAHWNDDIVLRLGNDAGVTIAVQVKSPGADRTEPVQLGVDFKNALGDVPEPYEMLLLSAMAGDKSFFPDEKSVEETWRIVQPIIDDPSVPLSYEPGSWGPRAAINMTASHGGWRTPIV